jgi:hypothetical protein
MRWVGNVDCMKCERNAYMAFKGELEDLEDFGVFGMV